MKCVSYNGYIYRMSDRQADDAIEDGGYFVGKTAWKEQCAREEAARRKAARPFNRAIAYIRSLL